MESFTPVVHEEWIKFKKTPEDYFVHKYFLVLIDDRLELKESKEDKPKKTLLINDIGSCKKTDNIIIITYLRTKDLKWTTMYIHCVTASRAQIINQYILQAMDYNKFIPKKSNESQKNKIDRGLSLSSGANLKPKENRVINELNTANTQPQLPTLEKILLSSTDLPDDHFPQQKQDKLSPKSAKSRPKSKIKGERIVRKKLQNPIIIETLNHSSPISQASSLVDLPSLSLSSPEPSNQIFRANTNPFIYPQINSIQTSYNPFVSPTPPLLRQNLM